MNGAELPDGSRLQVEASDPMYKLRKPKPPISDDNGTNVGGSPVAETPATTTETTGILTHAKAAELADVKHATPDEQGDGDGEGDELDDFFSSLA